MVAQDFAHRRFRLLLLGLQLEELVSDVNSAKVAPLIAFCDELPESDRSPRPEVD